MSQHSPKLHPRPAHGLIAQEKMQLREVFDLTDQDGSGRLDWKELRTALRGIGFAITRKEAKAILRNVDNDKDGLIDFEEFLTAIEQQSRSEVDVRKELIMGFGMLARKDSAITFDSLKQASQEMDLYFSHEELRAMLHVASSTGSERVSQEDFVLTMLKTNLF
eukprot:TRINITY_DN4965_c0_g1_i2.p2 TRINITY_DN4965_c0_g1~~TRINITY_DN4965_c0_g1_i2.p2  ORF type:complete len:164 (+),score=40.74 TRINITY_DN4965_c0_g1_i2:68-559(+)